MEQTKIIGLGAAAVAGGLAVPLLGQIDKATGGKYLYLSGGGALALGVGLGYFGRHPAFQGLGFALAAIGGYVLVADYQAQATAAQASTTTAGMVGMPQHVVMSAGQPAHAVGTNGRRYNLPEAYWPRVPKSRLPPQQNAVRNYFYS